jgi:L-fuconate dehydratase
MLEAETGRRAERIANLRSSGLPAYTTSAGWLGYDDEKVVRRTREAIADGYMHIKLKVGRNLDEDIRRCRLVRNEIGPERSLMVDANQVWSVPEAIEWMSHLAQFNVLWIEEPTSPDDILGHARIRREIAPVRVATGEHIQNRIVFKQLFQAEAIDVCQLDACRVGGVNEAISIQLLAAKFGIPVCPHAGGVGLCEYVQHLAIFDYLRVGCDLDGRMVEYVDHLHEHFTDPVRTRGGRYLVPEQPGYSSTLKPESIARFSFPDGPAWRA